MDNNSKRLMVGILASIMCLLVGIVIGKYLFVKECNAVKCVDKEKEEEKEKKIIDNVVLKTIDGEDYYVINGQYKGDYFYQQLNLGEINEDYDSNKDKIKLFNTTEILSYGDYVEFCERWGVKQRYTNTDKNYMVISYASYGQPIVEAQLANVEEKNNKITVYLWENTRGVTADIGAYVMVIPVNKDTYKKEIIMAITKEEYGNLKKYGTKYDPGMLTTDKPLIYIYPEKEMEVSIKLGKEDLITTSYPKYNKEWKVIASTNGNLKDISTNKNYYGLYWEGIKETYKEIDEGFVVKGEDTIYFLEEKLSILGLNEREINEFIIYWLPKMESNKYNYIRFETREEIDSNMPLEINPKPDTLIRVVMDFKPLNEKINVREQKLEKIERKGYTVVEWGATIIK